jgi:hypothetical protein
VLNVGMASSINPIRVQKFLGGLDYPVRKEQLVERARHAGADEKVQQALERLPDREYKTPIDVSQAIAGTG